MIDVLKLFIKNVKVGTNNPYNFCIKFLFLDKTNKKIRN